MPTQSLPITASISGLRAQIFANLKCYLSDGPCDFEVITATPISGGFIYACIVKTGSLKSEILVKGPPADNTSHALDRLLEMTNEMLGLKLEKSFEAFEGEMSTQFGDGGLVLDTLCGE